MGQALVALVLVALDRLRVEAGRQAAMAGVAEAVVATRPEVAEVAGVGMQAVVVQMGGDIFLAVSLARRKLGIMAEVVGVEFPLVRILELEAVVEEEPEHWVLALVARQA